MSARFYAHTFAGRPSTEWHDLEEHLRETAGRAREYAAAFGAGEWGEVAGLWHDLGKYSSAFQSYLEAAAGPDDAGHASEVSGRVDHSTAGAQHASRLGPLGYLLAYAIAGHHAGLPDHVGSDSSLMRRLSKSVNPIDEAPAALLGRRPTGPPRLGLGGSAGARGFTLAFFTRMVFSCLVDADFLDTESFMDPARAALRPAGPPSLEQLRDRLDAHLDAMADSASPTPVNARRAEVLAACRRKAMLPPGFFSLNVPTGGGKTLSSLAFGLAHAAGHGLRRVVYAIPFTSIIEQTATVFREALGDLGGALLEHHGTLDRDNPARVSPAARLAAENFDAPLIVTTNVQLFESLFAARTSRCRKLHRLAQSVIILDEAQALPPRLLKPTLAALGELVAHYGTTVVLCTATQPAVERRPEFPIGLDGVRSIIDDPHRLHASLRRTTIEHLGPIPNEVIATRLRAEPQALCIVNSRRHALDLFAALGDPEALHLSAGMCAAHRSATVDQIRQRLHDGRPCRVVSTQVIEAGVDVDFPAVYRAAAGLDAIAQAAGRCNREGRLADAGGRVAVFDADEKAYPTVPLIRDAAHRFREVAPDHADDLIGPAAVEHYFRLHYWQQGGANGDGWDRGAEGKRVLDCFAPDPKVGLHAQFREAADAYRLIDDAQVAVLVPHGERGNALIAELEALPEFPEPWRLRVFDRAAQRYVVSVYETGLRTLLQRGVLLERHGRFYLGNPASYDSMTGLSYEEIGLNPDRMIV